MAVELTPDPTRQDRPETPTRELGPDIRPLPKSVTAEFFGRDGKWHRFADFGALNGQPEAVLDELDADSASGDPNGTDLTR